MSAIELNVMCASCRAVKPLSKLGVSIVVSAGSIPNVLHYCKACCKRSYITLSELYYAGGATAQEAFGKYKDIQADPKVFLKPSEVPCKVCGALPLQSCKTPKGDTLKALHVRRGR